MSSRPGNSEKPQPTYPDLCPQVQSPSKRPRTELAAFGLAKETNDHKKEEEEEEEEELKN